MSNKNDTEQVTQIWSEFERGKDYFNKLNLVNEITKAHRFYEGEQWYGNKDRWRRATDHRYYRSDCRL